MDKRKVWKRYTIFEKNIEIKMPFAYNHRDTTGGQHVFMDDKGNGIVINDITDGSREGKEILLNIYYKIREKKDNISEPKFMKRNWRNSEQNMLQFNCDNKQYYVFVVMVVDKKQYLVEFTYSGDDVSSWNKEWGYIINSLKGYKGGEK